MDEISQVDGLEDVDVWELYELQQHEETVIETEKTVTETQKTVIEPVSQLTDEQKRLMFNLGNYETPEEINARREKLLAGKELGKTYPKPTVKWRMILDAVKTETKLALENGIEPTWRIIYTSENSEIMGAATREQMIKESSRPRWPNGIWMIRSRKQFDENNFVWLSSHTEVKFLGDSDTVVIQSQPRGGRLKSDL